MHDGSAKRAQTILVVEDNPEDFEAVVRALRTASVANPVHRCTDGDDALAYLWRRGCYADPRSAPRPGIILLDLDLPGTDGREVLATIKADAELKTIPVIVLTSSSEERDISGCYRSGANSYIQKPVDLAGLAEAVQRLKDFWLGLVILPSGGGARQ